MRTAQQQLGTIILPCLLFLTISTSLSYWLVWNAQLQQQIILNYQQFWQSLTRLEQDVAQILNNQDVKNCTVTLLQDFFLPDEIPQTTRQGWQIKMLQLTDLQQTGNSLYITVGTRIPTSTNQQKIELLFYTLSHLDLG